MKYNNLTGRQFNCRNFNYFCEHWPESSNISGGRGAAETTLFTVSRHQICTTPGPLFGVECVYEGYNKAGGNDFIYPVSELVRTGQITEKDLINTNCYAIF